MFKKIRDIQKNSRVRAARARFEKLAGKQPRFPIDDRSVFLEEATETTEFDRHYIYHPSWAARVLALNKPQKHVDIASTLHFCSLISAFIPTEFYDIRPANLNLSNLTTGTADLTKLPFADDSVASLSCMHTIEHVGLGRYGDALDPDGDLKTAGELQRVLARGGSLLVAMPVGKPKIVFNAHRVYSYDQVLSLFTGLTLKEFALIPDDAKDGGLIRHASKELADEQSYGCGCFWFTK